MNRTNFESNPGRFQERIDGSLGGRGRASRSFISAHKRTISRAISQIGKANRDSKMPRFARSDLCISLPKRYPVTRVSLFSAFLLSYGEEEGGSPPPWMGTAPRRWKIRRRLIETPSLQTGRVGKEDYRERRADNFTRRDV